MTWLYTRTGGRAHFFSKSEQRNVLTTPCGLRYNRCYLLTVDEVSPAPMLCKRCDKALVNPFDWAINRDPARD